MLALLAGTGFYLGPELVAEMRNVGSSLPDAANRLAGYLGLGTVAKASKPGTRHAAIDQQRWQGRRDPGFLKGDGSGVTHGRPVGVAVDAKGALLVADDVGNTVWRVNGYQMQSGTVLQGK